MSVSVTTPARNVNLATLASLKAELGLTTTDAARDSLLDDIRRRSSAAIEAYCHRTFAREVVSETVGAFGGPYLQLSRYPVASVASVTFNGQVWTDYSLQDRDKGWLYRRGGFPWTAQANAGLTGGYRFVDFGSPLPGSEEPLAVVEYTAGFLMPDDNVVAADDVSVDDADNSFNSASSGFPALLKAGDIIETRGFNNAANNGRHVVSGTPTAAKIIVTTTLVDELATTGAHSVLVQSLPADLEKACLESTKVFYLGRQTDPGVVEKQVGPMRVRYSESDNVMQLSLPPSVVGLLTPYVRRA